MKIVLKTAEWNDSREEPFLEEAAGLVYESFPEFYDLISSNKAAIHSNITLQLQDRNSELGRSSILLIEGALGGISVYYAAEEIKLRQLISLRYLLKMSDQYPNALERIKSYSRDVEPIPLPRYMNWARLGVKKEFRRQGIASLLNTAMELETKQAGFEYVGSHLNIRNGPSMKMHFARGFSRISEIDFRFIAMIKKTV